MADTDLVADARRLAALHERMHPESEVPGALRALVALVEAQRRELARRRRVSDRLVLRYVRLRNARTASSGTTEAAEP